MSQKNSDYTLGRPNVHDMLPAINQDPLINAVTEATYNRFYTKPELQRVIGTIGAKKSSTQDDQIVEADVYDQAFQLQPAIKNNASSQVQISTYKDIKRMCELLGIDTSRVKEWQNTERFNYALPIDLDKIVNYNEYYWVGTSLPEYIVIENPQVKLQAKLSQLISFYPTSPAPLVTWKHITDLLDIIHANNLPADTTQVQNFDLVMADPAHPPYVRKTVAPSNEFTLTSDWQVQNKWVHRLDVYDLSSVTQAKMPIIAYNQDVQLTEYTYTGQIWKYRSTTAHEWVTNSIGPSSKELFQRIAIVSASRDNDTVSVAGNQLATFKANEQITIEDATLYSGKWTVSGVQYNSTSNTTILKLVGNITTDAPSGHIRPFVVTSLGDDWKGIHTHWMLSQVETPKPSAAPTAFELVEEQFKGSPTLVRVSEDEDAPLEPRVLKQFKHRTQRKTTRNQYPLFDVVDIDGKSLRESSNIITFAEDPSAPVDTHFGSRISRDLLTKDFTFDIGLINADGTLRFYIDKSVGAPTSVWSTGDAYIPNKVDANRMVVPDATETAVYEIPSQLMSNVHHDARRTLKYSELFLHFKSIIDNQPIVDADVYGTNLTPSNSYRIKDGINYGVGGTIKEHNYSFDNFVSSLISSSYNLPTILSFAQNQYNELLVKVREHVEQNIVNAINSGTNLVDYLESQFLSSIRNDTNLSRIYGDSTVTKKSSISNWVATLPYLRLAAPVKPEYLRDDKLSILELVHHDGHTGFDELNTTTNNSTIANLIERLGLYPNRSQQPKPTGSIVDGTMWYEAATRTIYRFVDQTQSWVKFDLTDVIANVLLKIEQRLATGVNNAPLWTDSLPSIDTSLFNDLMQKEFESYCVSVGIDAPYRGNFDCTNSFTWNYTTTLGFAGWKSVYEDRLGTAYPHLQPWMIQGFVNKPVWWDAEYKDASNVRRWLPVMWANIKTGTIPAGHPQPSHTIRPVAHTSVNTTSHVTSDGYGPDDLLPPYWVPAVANDNRNGIADQALLRTMPALSEISVNTFAFGDGGPVEHAWKKSIDYKYASLRSMFRLDPIRFMHYTFGEEYTSVGGLEICKRTNKVLSHRDVVFHGDVDSTGTTQLFDGLNQMYVNFFRYNALDLNGSEFKRAWTSWTTQLCYSVGSFVIDKTLSVDSPLFEMTDSDYSVEVKTAQHIRDIWVDALFASISQAGSQRELPLGAGRDWKFNLGTHCPVARTTKYYGVKKYRITADTSINTFTIIDGTLSAAGWEAGDSIVFDTGTNGNLPNAVDDMTYYFIIPVSNTTFKIADSKEKALIGHDINLLTNGTGVFYVAELVSTFYALDGKHTPMLWKHFAINSKDVRSFTSTMTITGVQNIVDVVDGYAAYLKDQGIVFNNTTVLEYDQTNNRQITWQFELESLIDSLYLSASNLNGVNSASQNLGEVELNPFRSNIWLTHKEGVVSEFNPLDVKDPNVMAIVYDTNGNKVDTRNYHVLREDMVTHIAAINQVFDGTQSDQYNTVPLVSNFGGLHAYFDEYEHVLMFNDRTIANNLVYDSFLGISVPRLQTYFEKQSISTKRPNVGGFVMKDGKFVQNYEHTVSNILKYYDTFTVNENSDFVNYARQMLGYTPNASYMANTNVTTKSQFLFYKGMIKAKGTTGSIKAFTNSKHFTSAEVDEFWAYRAFDFGDSRADLTYTMSLDPEDTVRSHVKIQFVANAKDAVEEYFTQVALTDSSRWPDFPTQASQLSDSHALFGTNAILDQPAVAVVRAWGGVNHTVIEHPRADAITVYMPMSPTRIRITAVTQGARIIVLRNQQYVPGANAIAVYIDGILKTVNVDYLEIAINAIELIGQYTLNAVVVIVPMAATLVENVHYTRITSGLVELTVGSLEGLRITTRGADYSTISPVHVYDERSKVIVQNMPVWDPMDGIHQAELVQYVDLYDAVDPAIYNATPREANNDQQKFWNASELGKVWLDRNSYEYINYKDVSLSTNQRLVNWGKMEEWSDPSVYQWVESTVHPSNYTDGQPWQEVYSRARKVYTAAVVGGGLTLNRVHDFAVGAEVSITTPGDLPNPLKVGVVYTVCCSTANTISVADRFGKSIALQNGGSGIITVTSATFSGDWTLVRPMVQHHRAILINQVASTLATGLPVGTEFSLFVDGMYVQDGPVLANGVIAIDPETLEIINQDVSRKMLTVIKKTGIMDGLATTKPADLDLTPLAEQSYVGYPHTMVDNVNQSGVMHQPLYYFWARGVQNTLDDAQLFTTTTIEKLVSRNERPYMICQNPEVVKGEVRMSQLILAGISAIVSEPDRYTLRIRKNYTLRQELLNKTGSMLKPTHSEWIMFRQNQIQHINRSLWNMVTESIVGYSLKDPSVSIPALDRTIYDSINGTSTRFGIGDGQALVNGATALETILVELNSPETDFAPIDIDFFLETHTTADAEGLLKFMDDIYTSFPAHHVNKLFFAVLLDALANIDVDYSGSLMKTSAISINGITPLNVNGVFDD